MCAFFGEPNNVPMFLRSQVFPSQAKGKVKRVQSPTRLSNPFHQSIFIHTF